MQSTFTQEGTHMVVNSGHDDATREATARTAWVPYQVVDQSSEVRIQPVLLDVTSEAMQWKKKLKLDDVSAIFHLFIK